MYLRTILLGRASTSAERGSFQGSLLLVRLGGGGVDEGLVAVGCGWSMMMATSSRKDVCGLVGSCH
jgi:hypothetical protein